jgi:hypothetical protein
MNGFLFPEKQVLHPHHILRCIRRVSDPEGLEAPREVVPYQKAL